MRREMPKVQKGSAEVEPAVARASCPPDRADKKPLKLPRLPLAPTNEPKQSCPRLSARYLRIVPRILCLHYKLTAMESSSRYLLQYAHLGEEKGGCVFI